MPPFAVTNPGQVGSPPTTPCCSPFREDPPPQTTVGKTRASTLPLIPSATIAAKAIERRVRSAEQNTLVCKLAIPLQRRIV